MMQELEWRPRYYSGGVAPLTDPVDVMLFKFYDDQLFMVVADYDRRRTEGMSAEDMIAAISETYGPVSQVPSRRLGTPTVQYGFPDTPLAVWGTTEYSVTLLRVAYPASFRLVVAHTRLENLARTATAAAVGRIPTKRRSASSHRQKSEAADSAAAQEKAKSRKQGAVQALVRAVISSNGEDRCSPGCASSIRGPSCSSNSRRRADRSSDRRKNQKGRSGRRR